MKKTTDRINSFKWTYVETVICIGSLLILASPFLLAKSFSSNLFKGGSDIGGYIGGITAPLTSLLGAWLVYKALKIQIDANVLIQNQIHKQEISERHNKRLQHITQQLQILREDIKEYKFKEKDEYGSLHTYEGPTAIEQQLLFFVTFKKHNLDIDKIRISSLSQIKHFLTTILYLLNLADELENEDRDNIKRIILATYTDKLYSYLEAYESYRSTKVEECPECGKRHPSLPEYIYQDYDSINIKLKDNQVNGFL